MCVLLFRLDAVLLWRDKVKERLGASVELVQAAILAGLVDAVAVLGKDGELETVGIWMQNRPGMYRLC